jgi:hypothetical protein
MSEFQLREMLIFSVNNALDMISRLWKSNLPLSQFCPWDLSWVIFGYMDYSDNLEIDMFVWSNQLDFL